MEYGEKKKPKDIYSRFQPHVVPVKWTHGVIYFSSPRTIAGWVIYLTHFVLTRQYRTEKEEQLFFFFPKFIELILFIFSVRWIACYTHTVPSIFIILRLLCHLYVCFFFLSFSFVSCFMCDRSSFILKKFVWMGNFWGLAIPFSLLLHYPCRAIFFAQKSCSSSCCFFFFPTIKSSSSSSSFPDFPNQFLTAIWLISFLESSSWCVVYFF